MTANLTPHDFRFAKTRFARRYLPVSNQAEKLKIILKRQERIAELHSLLESAIMRLAEQYQPQIQLLMSVPGISTPFTAIRILAEIGADMSVHYFRLAKTRSARRYLSVTI